MENIQETGVIEGAADPSMVDEVKSTGGQPKEDFVPVSALQAERKERQALQENLKMLQDHVSLLQANQVQPKSEPYHGLADDDVLTVGEAKKFIGSMQKDYRENISELRMTQKYQDYTEVISKYLPEVIQANPSLRDTLNVDPNKYETAYILARNSESYRKAKHERKKSADAERIVQNASKPGSLSAMGSASPQSHTGNWKSMSDDEFMKHVHKHLGSF